MDKKVGRIAFWIYTLVSLALVGIFLLLTLTTGETYTVTAYIGGSIWIFLLGLIVTMPIFIPWAKKKYGDGTVDDTPMHHH